MDELPDLKPAYLICGTDQPKVRRSAARLRKRVFDETASDLNISLFDARIHTRRRRAPGRRHRHLHARHAPAAGGRRRRLEGGRSRPRRRLPDRPGARRLHRPRRRDLPQDRAPHQAARKGRPGAALRPAQAAVRRGRVGAGAGQGARRPTGRAPRPATWSPRWAPTPIFSRPSSPSSPPTRWAGRSRATTSTRSARRRSTPASTSSPTPSASATRPAAFRVLEGAVRRRRQELRRGGALHALLARALRRAALDGDGPAPRDAGLPRWRPRSASSRSRPRSCSSSATGSSAARSSAPWRRSPTRRRRWWAAASSTPSSAWSSPSDGCWPRARRAHVRGRVGRGVAVPRGSGGCGVGKKEPAGRRVGRRAVVGRWSGCVAGDHARDAALLAGRVVGMDDALGGGLVDARGELRWPRAAVAA